MLSASKMLITSICEADSLPAAKFLKPNKMKHRVFLALNITKIIGVLVRCVIWARLMETQPLAIMIGRE